MTEKIPVSIGELWDKYSILLIKKEKISKSEKLIIVENEINILNENMNNYTWNESELFKKLKKINEKLWTIEDKLRIKECQKQFDDEFIQLARSVYYTNDMRAEIKGSINVHFNSNIHEVKDYVNYN
jgi:hypothetical protein